MCRGSGELRRVSNVRIASILLNVYTFSQLALSPVSIQQATQLAEASKFELGLWTPASDEVAGLIGLVIREADKLSTASSAALVAQVIDESLFP